jgi:dethiobiotin synthetase
VSAGWFVTGTDTGVGKTLVSCALLHALRARGRRAVGMKPVAAGCERGAAGLVNEDIEALLAASTPGFTREEINAYAFEPPIAPHLAAAEAGIAIDFARIERQYRELAMRADCVVVEGAGGWLVPLSPSQTFADLAQRLSVPVVLVVGMRLGCLNHALLTAQSIQRAGLPLAGWVANRIDRHMPRFDENLAALRARVAAPLLGAVAFQAEPDPQRAARELSLP